MKTNLQCTRHLRKHHRCPACKSCKDSDLATEVFADGLKKNDTPEVSSSFASVLQQKGLPPNSLALFPKLKESFVKKVLVQDPDLASWIPQEVDRVAVAPPRDRMTYDTLDSYIDERLRDVSLKLILYATLR